MTATFGQLIERARSFVRDSDGAFIDDEDLAAWINEGYKDIAARLEVLQRTQLGTTSAQGTVALPTTNDTFTVAVLSLRVSDIEVQFVNATVFKSWADTTSVPPTTLGNVWDNEVLLFPAPVDEQFEMRVAFVPGDLVQPDDVHVLPAQLERKMVEYAVAQAKLKDEDYAGSDRWFLKYEQGLPQVSTGRSAEMPGPMSFAPELSYFEIDALQNRSART